MFVDFVVNDIIHRSWTKDWRESTLSAKQPPRYKPWRKVDTYFIVFSPGQDDALKFFEENCGGFNILYKGEKAYNWGHGPTPRNTLIIFEVKEEFFGESNTK